MKNQGQGVPPSMLGRGGGVAHYSLRGFIVGAMRVGGREVELPLSPSTVFAMKLIPL